MKTLIIFSVLSKTLLFIVLISLPLVGGKTFLKDLNEEDNELFFTQDDNEKDFYQGQMFVNLDDRIDFRQKITNIPVDISGLGFKDVATTNTFGHALDA